MNIPLSNKTQSLCQSATDLARSFATAEFIPSNSMDFLDLCIDWAQTFEAANKNRIWDGEWLFEIEAHFLACYTCWVNRTSKEDRHPNPSYKGSS